MPTNLWMKQLEPRQSVLVQVGANQHSDTSYQNAADPGPFAVQLRWHALLIEPMPTIFGKLRSRYKHLPRSRVQLEMGAVCDTCGGSRSIYSVRRHSSLSAMHSHCMRALFSCAVWPVCGYRWIFSTGQRDLT
jgi:hypothetical protein